MTASDKIKISVQSEPIVVEEAAAILESDDHSVGAVASFLGLCRDDGGRLSALELEHYPGMAERQLRAIVDEACARWPLDGAVLYHRYGKVVPGETIVYVATTSRHRDAAFDGVRFIMDYLKTDAPFWKKEHLKDGAEGEWVSAADKDDLARQRWS